jgi:methylmalonyl-CoA mutase cobalamin-binding subunit
MGGAIPRSDYQFLSSAGVDLIFNSMPVDRTAIHQVLNLFE